MNVAPSRDRDERSVVVGHKSPVNNITERFQPAGGGSKRIDRTQSEHFGSAVRGEQKDREQRIRDEVHPPVLRRVLKDTPVINFRMPDAVSYRSKLHAGKIISDQHYDLVDLKAQGVLLGDVEAEILGVPAGGGNSQVQLRDMLEVLRGLGLDVVARPDLSAPPAGNSAESSEIDRLRAEVAELKNLLSPEVKTAPKPDAPEAKPSAAPVRAR